MSIATCSLQQDVLLIECFTEKSTLFPHCFQSQIVVRHGLSKSLSKKYYQWKKIYCSTDVLYSFINSVAPWCWTTCASANDRQTGACVRAPTDFGWRAKPSTPSNRTPTSRRSDTGWIRTAWEWQSWTSPGHMASVSRLHAWTSWEAPKRILPTKMRTTNCNPACWTFWRAVITLKSPLTNSKRRIRRKRRIIFMYLTWHDYILWNHRQSVYPGM